MERFKTFAIEETALPDKEKALFRFVIKADYDAHSVSDEEYEEIRQLGATDEDVVVAVECMNFFAGFNKFLDVLKIDADPWLVELEKEAVAFLGQEAENESRYKEYLGL